MYNEEMYPNHREDADEAKNRLGWNHGRNLFHGIEGLNVQIQRESTVPPPSSLGLGIHGVKLVKPLENDARWKSRRMQTKIKPSGHLVTARLVQTEPLDGEVCILLFTCQVEEFQNA